MSKQNDILSPADFIRQKGIDDEQIVCYFCKDGIGNGTDIDIEKLLEEYAAHVARRVHRNTRHQIIDIILDYDRETTLGDLVDSMTRDIQNHRYQDAAKAETE